MSRRDDLTSLEQMRDHAREVLQFSDRVLALALIRLLEIIGETATRVGSTTRGQHPEIPWQQIVGLRNRLIHGYDTVDMSIVWRIVRDDTPRLVRDLDALLQDGER